MANQKITELVSLEHNEVQSQDLFVLVDRDDLSSPTGRTKNIEAIELSKYIIGTETLISGSKQIQFKQLGDVSGSAIPEYNVVVDASGSNIIYEPKTFKNLTDTPNDYTGYNNYLVRVNSLGNGLEFVTSGSIIPQPSTISQVYYQPGHNFKLGDAVYRNVGNVWVEASSASDITSEVGGIISNVNGSYFTVAYAGIVSGFNGLTPGSVWFLSETVNVSAPDKRNLSTTPSVYPSYNKPVLLSISNDSALILTYRPLAINPATGSSSNSSNSISQTFTQIGHNFKLGDAVYRNSSNVWVEAVSTTESTTEVAGVISNVNGNSFTVSYGGIVSGFNGLTPGSVWFLSETVNVSAPDKRNLTITEPNYPSFSKPILLSITDTEALVLTYRAISYNNDPEISRGFLKNKIINGEFNIWQRGDTFKASSSFSANKYTSDGLNRYIADRWYCGFLGHVGGSVTQSLSISSLYDNPIDPPFNGAGYYACKLSHTNLTTDTTGLLYISQPVEDVKTLAGKQVVFSLYIKPININNITLTLRQYFGEPSPPASSRVTVASETKTLITNVWQRVHMTTTLPVITGKNLGIGNYLSCEITFLDKLNASTGSMALPDFPTIISGVPTDICYITGVQLEEGSEPTEFEVRDTGTELFLCQRYYESTLPNMFSTIGMVEQSIRSNFAALNTCRFLKQKRVNPTVKVYDAMTLQSDRVNDGGSIGGPNNVTTEIFDLAVYPNGFYVSLSTTPLVGTPGNNYAYFYTADAEIY